jgi:hypothetical protein
MSSCTTSRDLPSNVWWLYTWGTELSPLPCDFLQIKYLLLLHLETWNNFICKKSQCKGDNSVCHWCSYQTLLGKSLDVVQEDMLYVKSDKIREIIQFVTYTVSLTLSLFTYKISSCTTSRDLPSNVWWLYKWQTELSPLSCHFLLASF